MLWDLDATDLVGKFTHFVGRVLDVLDLATWRGDLGTFRDCKARYVERLLNRNS